MANSEYTNKTRPGTVDAIVTKDGRVFVGRSNRENATGHSALDSASNSCLVDDYNSLSTPHGNGHGNCAEIPAIDKAMSAGATLKGAVSVSMVVRSGQTIPACISCNRVIPKYGIIDGVNQNGSMKSL